MFPFPTNGGSSHHLAKNGVGEPSHLPSSSHLKTLRPAPSPLQPYSFLKVSYRKDAANSAYTLSEEIAALIAEHHEALKGETATQIAELVAQIQTVITPLLEWNTVNECLERCLGELEDVLAVTRTNLRKWKESRSHRLHISFSRSAPRELRDNIEYLIRHHKSLMDTLQIVMHVKGYNYVIPTQSIRSFIENKSEQKMKTTLDDVDGPSPYEAKEFWKFYIGDETEFAESEEFCGLLSEWMDEYLDETAQKRLLLRLDQNHSGYISFGTFQSFVKNGKLRETIHLYSMDPHLPLLIWIDGDVSRVVPQILEATTQGVKILQFSSTSATKAWITLNKEFLKKHDDPAKIRIIVNQEMYERNDSHMSAINDAAGLEITTHVREAGINIPILIYTTKENITTTQYVNDFVNVGSLSGNHFVYLAYVSALAKGKRDDVLWKKYNA